MTLFYPPLKPYPCGCTPLRLCDEHHALVEQRKDAIRHQNTSISPRCWRNQSSR